MALNTDIDMRGLEPADPSATRLVPPVEAIQRKSPYYVSQVPTNSIINPDAVVNFRQPGIPQQRIVPPQPINLAGAGLNATPARGDLHQPGQPLEPLMEAGAPELIVPNGLLKDVKSGEYLFLRHGMFAGNTNTILVLERVPSPASASMFAVYLVGNIQMHGLIRKRPGNLGDLQDFLKTAGIDVVAACQEAMRQYLDLGGQTGERTIMAVLVDLPKARHEGEPEEWRDRLAFITAIIYLTK
jgi:hypothetical protein